MFIVFLEEVGCSGRQSLLPDGGGPSGLPRLPRASPQCACRPGGQAAQDAQRHGGAALRPASLPSEGGTALVWSGAAKLTEGEGQEGGGAS